ncbi:hypothetical protein [Syntrophomonas curvata]
MLLYACRAGRRGNNVIEGLNREIRHEAGLRQTQAGGRQSLGHQETC